MTDGLVIRGGAGPEEAAAIAAVVAHVLADEAAARAVPPRPPQQSPWVLAWRPRDIPELLPSHTFDPTPWGGVGGDDDNGEG